MPESGWRALGIWLAVVCMLIALVFPLHHTLIVTPTGKDAVDARPFDVLMNSYDTSGTLVSTSVASYLTLTTTNSILLYMNAIWMLVIGLALILLFLEYFKAKDMHRHNQFAMLGTFFAMLGVIAFYSAWSGYVLTKYGYGFSENLTTHATGMGIGFYGAIFGVIIGFLVVLEGYINKH